MRELVSNPELCDACMLCERSCPKNAIRIIDSIPFICLHCSPEKAPCLNICPENAIEENDGAIVVNIDHCIGCGLCKEACPIGAIIINESGLASKCDLCIDREVPVCVSVCPKDALTTDSETSVHEKQDKLIKDLNKLKEIMK